MCLQKIISSTAVFFYKFYAFCILICIVCDCCAVLLACGLLAACAFCVALPGRRLLAVRTFCAALRSRSLTYFYVNLGKYLYILYLLNQKNQLNN